ncbi:hypothetical protein CLF_110810 [Clonorchis sinensis]|uniref:Uncharacterized protein n=1 Tax=Clonorchis sinensis TaxID=79923 RepID=G7YTW8_CLOSI|nr:hypothetical protein CLF_110810 [Clonorchis sinensis]
MASFTDIVAALNEYKWANHVVRVAADKKDHSTINHNDARGEANLARILHPTYAGSWPGSQKHHSTINHNDARALIKDPEGKTHESHNTVPENPAYAELAKLIVDDI